MDETRKKEAPEIIANNLPTWASCYVNPTRIVQPSMRQLLEAADNIIEALEREGYRIVSVQSGVQPDKPWPRQ